MLSFAARQGLPRFWTSLISLKARIMMIQSSDPPHHSVGIYFPYLPTRSTSGLCQSGGLRPTIQQRMPWHFFSSPPLHRFPYPITTKEDACNRRWRKKEQQTKLDLVTTPLYFVAQTEGHKAVKILWHTILENSSVLAPATASQKYGTSEGYFQRLSEYFHRGKPIKESTNRMGRSLVRTFRDHGSCPKCLES